MFVLVSTEVWGLGVGIENWNQDLTDCEEGDVSGGEVEKRHFGRSLVCTVGDLGFRLACGCAWCRPDELG